MTTTPADTVRGRAPPIVDRLLPFAAALPVLVLGGRRAGDQAFWMDEGASRHIATLPSSTAWPPWRTRPWHRSVTVRSSGPSSGGPR